MDDVQMRRLAQNETIFRQVNEHVRQAEERVRHDYPRFICECSKMECDEQVRIGIDDYRLVREHPARFIVATDHADERIEKVVDRALDYDVVEKIGPGRDVAEDDAG